MHESTASIVWRNVSNLFRRQVRLPRLRLWLHGARRAAQYRVLAGLLQQLLPHRGPRQQLYRGPEHEGLRARGHAIRVHGGHIVISPTPILVRIWTVPIGTENDSAK
jgi:hypothetical protein